MPIVCFHKKYNKDAENDKISNRHDGFSKDVELGNTECEEESVKRFVETYWEKLKEKQWKII